jgi:hypothetical protein
MSLPNVLLWKNEQFFPKECYFANSYIPKKHKNFGIKTYKVCSVSGYTHIATYLLKDRTHATVDDSNSCVTSAKGQQNGH